MIAEKNPPSFFVAGGTVPPDAASYVEREADRELLQALLAGEYCYVLNSRQMGKSSLAVQTIDALQRAGVTTAFVDLTRLGGNTVTADQWYAGLLVETGRALGVRGAAAKLLRDSSPIGPAQRYLAFLEENLASLDGPLVVMIDEIDAVRSLPFSTDELFAGIRQLHNGRASEPELNRLTFCLLGAALPSDLIRDPRTTPFNVGRRIGLRDLSPKEAERFGAALGPNGVEVVRRVYYWTGGHPFLTQALCAQMATQEALQVDDLVRSTYLDARARNTDTNLADVGNRLLGRGDPNVRDEDRADTLSLYRRLLKTGIADDESNPSCARIKMSGVARLEDGRLVSRNRIYRRVFNEAWIRENMPGQELRRQRRAFWLGVIRTSAISGSIIAVIGYLAWNNAKLADMARRQRDAALYDTYVASMRLLPSVYRQSNLREMNRILESERSNPARGWEWSYWRRLANPATLSFPLNGYVINGQPVSPDGRYILGQADDPPRVGVFEVDTGRMAFSIPTDRRLTGRRQLAFAEGGRLIVIATTADQLATYDALNGKELHFVRLPGFEMTTLPKTGHYTYGIGSLGIVKIDLDTLSVQATHPMPNRYRGNPRASLDGRYLLWHEIDPKTNALAEIVAPTGDGREIDRNPVPNPDSQPTLSPDSRFVAQTVVGGKLMLRDAFRRSTRLIHHGAGAVHHVYFSPDGNSLLLVGNSRAAQLWSLGAKPAMRHEFLDAQNAGFLPDGSIFTVSDRLSVYRPKSWRPPSVARLPTTAGSCVTPNGILFGSVARGGLIILDLTKPHAAPYANLQTSGNVYATIPSPSRWVRLNLSTIRVEVGNMGETTARASYRMPDRSQTKSMALGATTDLRYCIVDKSVYEFGRPTAIATLSLPMTPMMEWVTFDDRWLVVGDESGLVSVFRVGNWTRPVWTFKEGGLAYLSAAQDSPDGSKLAIGMTDDDAVILDSRTGAVETRLTGNGQAVTDIAWSPDGRRIATGSGDRTVRLWDSQTGRQLCVLGTHPEQVDAVQFLPGGRTLASVSSSGVKFWQTEDRR